MSAFGTGEPKFVGTGDPDSATVLLPGGEIITPGWVIPDVIEQVAPATGFRRFLQGGDAPTGGSNYSEFTVMVKIFDNTQYATQALKNAKMLAVWAYNQKYVYFYPYGNAVVKNNAGTSVRFFMTVSFGVHEANQKFDIMYLNLKSEDYTDAIKSLYIAP
jgi:hypothetical protein